MPIKKAIIEIKRLNTGEYIGHVVWLKHPIYPKGDKMEGITQIDRNNKNPKLRQRRVLGLQVVGDLFEKNNSLKGGWIYDSWNEKMGSVATEPK